jgi:hypothetical protein
MKKYFLILVLLFTIAYSQTVFIPVNTPTIVVMNQPVDTCRPHHPTIIDSITGCAKFWVENNFNGGTFLIEHYDSLNYNHIDLSIGFDSLNTRLYLQDYWYLSTMLPKEYEYYPWIDTQGSVCAKLGQSILITVIPNTSNVTYWVTNSDLCPILNWIMNPLYYNEEILYKLPYYIPANRSNLDINSLYK